MLQSQNVLENLTQDLKGYGLNPSEWTLIKERSGTYKITHQKDKDFVFRGQTERKAKGLSWKMIALESI